MAPRRSRQARRIDQRHRYPALPGFALHLLPSGRGGFAYRGRNRGSVPRQARGFDRPGRARDRHTRATALPDRRDDAGDCRHTSVGLKRIDRVCGRGRERMSHSLDAYLILSGLLFGIGVFGFLARRNAIAMLMSIELMLNAVNLAAIAFGAFTPSLQDHAALIALLVMAVAAAEATVGLAIVIAIYRNRRTPLVDEYASMRE